MSQWLTLHTLGRRPRTQEFNKEIVEIICRQWPGWINGSVSRVTAGQAAPKPNERDKKRRMENFIGCAWFDFAVLPLRRVQSFACLLELASIQVFIAGLL